MYKFKGDALLRLLKYTVIHNLEPKIKHWFVLIIGLDFLKILNKSYLSNIEFFKIANSK